MLDSVNPEAGNTSADLRKGRKREPRRAHAAASTADRLPPHSIEAELGVLGCMMLAPNECIGMCVEKFKAGADVFYDLKHQVIYETLIEMYEEKQGVDVITLHQRLKDKQQLEAVGGLDYIAPLPDKVPSAANLKFYQDIVWDKHILRKMIRTCTDVISRVYETEGEVDVLVDEVETEILRISEEKEASKTGMLTIKDVVHKAINKIEEYHQRQGMLTGLSSGFADLDKMTSGFHGGEMIVIAARPSVGKTSLAMNVAEAVAIDQKLPVGVFSLEMSSESLVLRMLCSRARVNMRNVRDGFLAERDFPKITTAAGKLASAPLYIDDTAGLSILQLRAKARRMWQQYGIKLFVIDYLQLLHTTNRRADNRQQEIADISSGIKALAKELDVPVVVLAQLNRSMEKEGFRRPRMSDLRESGAIEQDADLIGLLYDPNKKDEEDDAPQEHDSKDIVLYIAKQRNGPVGDVHLTFMKTYTRFENSAKIAPEDVPES
ncbi:MAG TPA: replicative DNA helicase [Candidatus Acidoferrum sp.]|nr:replicative DNA helicase [Candidatus Acidoferrum sp.]